ncbi:patatin-like phospholipase family protein [Vallitalea okinawensis]|uniref:patatin-like phospholipase family protein n=1 Tax=Vallitalea okinawensis TaxID=2078660 RepID=UPI000CFABB74|nr:patatin-like phospholipase family protein [Vallitalea okinawensis]
MKDFVNKEVGIVLEGGGARGAYQIGAWKALREIGVTIKGVVGASVGALNGAMMAQDEYDQAYKLWQNIKYSQVIDVDDQLFEKIRSLNIVQEDLKDVAVGLKKLIKNSGFDITPMRQMLSEVLEEEKIRQSGIDFGLVTISLSDFKSIETFIEDIPNGLLEDFLLASAYLPVFKTEKLHGKYYMDGGFYNNLPIKMLIDKGYKDIIVIRIHGIGHIPRYEVPEDVSVTYIEPKESLGGSLDFISDNARYNIKLGYHDTMNIFQELKGNQYYIQSTYDEAYYISKFLDLPKKAVKYFTMRYGNDELSDERNIMEYILPRLAKKVGLPNSWSYEELFISIYEHVASTMGIERFQIYDLENFIQMVKGGSVVQHEETLLDRLLDDRFSKVMIYTCKHW